MIPEDHPLGRSDIEQLLREDFDASLNAFRLFLDKSKDELETQLRAIFPEDIRPTRAGFAKAPADFVSSFLKTGIAERVREVVSKPVSWIDVMAERLKAGRGSAIKGQRRGRALEDSVEESVRSVYGVGNYDVRCSFLGKDGTSTAKCDFAIPARANPNILIEVKAFGATGSKQTNVIGDARAIRDQKRHDTTFIVVTDGVTWHARTSDLKELVKMQNAGDIYRIYTKNMEEVLLTDLT